MPIDIESPGAKEGDLIAALVALVGGSVGLPLAVQRFTASGTYTRTEGAKRALLLAQAPGGGGGGVGSSSGYGWGGFGSAGETRLAVVDVSSLSSAAVTIGAAGAGGAVGNNPGTDGGDVVFGALLTAKGGKAGGGSTGASSPLGANGAVPTGGAGGVVIPQSPPQHGALVHKAGGAPLSGNGAALSVGRDFQGDGADASGPGCGGGGGNHSGGATPRAGGAGGSGWLLVIEFGAAA